MKKLLIAAAAVIALAGFSSKQADCMECVTIKSGTIKDSGGNTIKPGYDTWGYNYQAKGYNGLYGNFSRPAVPVTDETCGGFDCDNLEMKWNEAWLSNVDCNNDGKLDRASDFNGGSYIGTEAWLTNHMSGTYLYTDDKGRTKEAHWTYFVKIVAVPVGATLSGGKYYNEDGEEIGPMIWNEFAIIQSVYNDPQEGFHGKEYLSPVNPGLGSSK